MKSGAFFFLFTLLLENLNSEEMEKSDLMESITVTLRAIVGGKLPKKEKRLMNKLSPQTFMLPVKF